MKTLSIPADVSTTINELCAKFGCVPRTMVIRLLQEGCAALIDEQKMPHNKRLVYRDRTPDEEIANHVYYKFLSLSHRQVWWDDWEKRTAERIQQENLKGGVA